MRLLHDLGQALSDLAGEDVPLPDVPVPYGWQERRDALVDVFDLDALSADLLLLAVVRELDPRIGVAEGLLSPSTGGAPSCTGAALLDEPVWRVVAALSEAGALRSAGLLPGDPHAPLVPHPRLVAHLLADARPGPDLAPVLVSRMQADPRDVVVRVAELLVTGTPVHLLGRPGAWTPPVAATALVLLEQRALVLDLDRAPLERRPLLLREALLDGALRGLAVVVGPWESFGGGAAAAATACAAARTTVVSYGTEPWPLRGTARPAVEVEVAPLGPADRAVVLSGLLVDAGLDDADAERLGGAPEVVDVALEADELEHVVRSAWATGHAPDAASLRRGVARLRERSLPPGTRVLRQEVVLDAVVATPTVRQALQDVVDQARHVRQVMDDWGLGQLSAGRRGTTALFAGPPGTGKTLSATAVASELGRPLYVVDVGAVVDKYVGETEKRLERIFTAVEQAQAVLLFDEADALFGRRGGVTDARDRFANIEVSYLLQRLEDFDGVLLLTTNMRNNLDEAFLRRLDHVVTFAAPEAPEREALWRRHLPESLPGAGEVDIAALAAVALSGGEVRNAVLAAATRCAATSSVVTTAALLAAAHQEVRKQGRLVPAG